MKIGFNKPEKFISTTILIIIGLMAVFSLSVNIKKMILSRKNYVLIINTNKTNYSKNEIVNFHITSLDDKGHVRCKSNLNLYIRGPGTNKNLPVIRSSTCGNKSTNDPDYSSSLQAKYEGDYEYVLTDEDTGKKTGYKFAVESQKESVGIERSGATRINPSASGRYPMIIKVTADHDFKGIIVEKIPASFELKWQGPAKVSVSGSDKFLTWKIDLKKGESDILSYEYLPSGNGAYSYKIGPIGIGVNQQSLTVIENYWEITVTGK